MFELSLHSCPGVCCVWWWRHGPGWDGLLLWPSVAILRIIWLSCRKFCGVLQGKRYTSWPWIACLDTEWVDLVFTWWKYPFSRMLFVVWGCSWGALHSKSHSKVCCLLMSRNKWLQQMREVQENSKTECLAVHQLLSFCQAFCWLCKGKKLKSILKREKKIKQGLISPAAKGCSSLKYLPVSPHLQGLIHCLQPCDYGMWGYGQILRAEYFL